MKKITFNSLRNNSIGLFGRWLAIFMLFLVLGSFSSYAQTTYYSKSTATDFNSLASWGTATDGTGAAPASISNADNFIVANSAAMTLSATATVRQLTINAGSLTVGANALTVSKAGAFDSTLTVNSGGTLNFSGGTITVNGNVLFASGSNFNQSGGTMNVDGNNGGSATGSVASGTPIFAIGTSGTSYSTGTLTFTGGTITIVDPHTATTNANGYALYINFPSGVNIECGTGHTFRMGDGVSTDVGGAPAGFWVDPYVGSGRLNFGKFTINSLARNVGTPFTIGVHSDLNIASGNFAPSALILKGNLNVTGGAYITTGGLTLAAPLTTSSAVANAAQTITVTAPGVVKNALTGETANYSSVTINNTGGATFTGTSTITGQPANSISVNSTLTFTIGKISTTGGAPFVLGNSTPSAGTLSYTSGGFASGIVFGRWFTATGTGATIAASTDANAAAGRYPFVTSAGIDRSAFIERNTPAAAAGVLAVTYTEAAGIANVTAIDGAVTTDRKTNDSWTVSALSGTPTAAASIELMLMAPSAFGGPLLNASTRVIQGSAYIGTHQAGTVTPGGQRLLSPTELVAGPFSVATVATDTPFTTIASGNWNDIAIWNKGTLPTCTDVAYIQSGHTVTVNSAANSLKGLNVNAGGTLVVASGDLTVGCTLKNNTFTNNGTLTVSGGTLNINGNMNHAAGSTFNQSGGDINVDGNDAGTAANSVASGTSIVQINTNLVNWTGGMLTIVDPHANSTNSYSFQYSGANVDVTTGTHTIRFGNGTSTDAGGSTTYGFRYNVNQGSGRISFNNMIINGATGTNRFITNAGAHGINGDLTVNAASEFRDAANIVYVAKNLVNNGTYISTGTFYAGTFLASTAGPSTNTQTISGSGVFSNNVTVASATAKLTSFTVNNTNATGVTLSLPISLSGTLTLTAGKVNTTTANLLSLGTATAAGTLSGGSTTAYITGPFARTIANSNANTNFIGFPVGKAAYAPIFLAPATTAVTVMRAEAFDTNTGTADATLSFLTPNRRWEAPLISGTITDIRVRLGDANITNMKIPVLAPAAAGVYTASFGITSTYVAGTPNTVQSIPVVTAANYTGFVSFAENAVCAGVPNPGNTIASTNNICSGTAVTFSVQNATAGNGVTYQWQTSANGTSGWTDVATATASTLTTVPTAPLYYRLNVTCSAGPVTGSSVPVQITFPNAAPVTTGANKCGPGALTLSATGGGAGTTIKWYSGISGGVPIGSGPSFTTPSLTATATYYAGVTSPNLGTAVVGEATTTTNDTEEVTAFNNRRTTYKSQTIYTAAELTAAGVLPGNIVSIAYNIASLGSGTNVTNYTVKMGTTALAAFPDTNYLSETSFTTVYGPVTYTHAVGLNTVTFTTPFPWDGTSNIVISVSMGGANSTNNARTYYTDLGTNTTLYNYNSLTATTGTSTTKKFNVTFGGQVICSSARTAAVATINTPPAIALSGNPAAICSGQSTAAVTITTGAGSYDTFVWSPSTGVTGNATTGWTFNPAATTSYSLQASQSGGTLCSATPVTVVVNVNPLPPALTAPATVSTCVGTVQSIASGAPVNGNALIGTGTTSPSSTTMPQPFTAWYGGAKTQMIFKASELQAQGLIPGVNITTLAFDFEASVANACNDLRIKIGPTTNTDMAAGLIASSTLTTVYNASWTPTTGTTGLVPFTLTTPYLWTGGDIIIEVAHNQGNSGNGSGTRTRITPSGFQSVYTGLVDGVTPAGVASLDATTTYSGNSVASSDRPNIRFTFVTTNTTTWTPVTNLYTDAAATIPYTAGTSAATVYYKSSTAVTNVPYTITTATTNGCSRTANVNVTVTATAAPTVPAATQDICNAGTVADLVATGTAIKWYAASTGGTALAPTTALVNNTQYFASQTVDGCESVARTGRTAVVNVVAAPTVADAAPVFCNAATVANLLPNGPEIKWYAGSTGGTVLASTTPLVSGTPYYASQTVNGCEGLLRATVTPTINVVAAPAIADNTQEFCNAATVADLVPNGTEIKWYTGTTGGTALASTDALVSGTPYYASQTIDGCEGLVRGMVTATILVTPAPVIPQTSQEFCNAATVAELLPNDPSIKWYAASTGGTALASTDALVDGASYFASLTADGCEGLVRTEVAVTVNVTPVPTGDDEQEFCAAATIADLVVDGNAVLWYDAETGGNILSGNTSLEDGVTYYAAQVIAGCEGLTRLGVTAVIHNVVVDAPADVAACTEYVLPALTSGAYFTEAGGTGIELAAGSVINETTTLYVYAEEGTDVVCSDENSFTVTIANVEAPTGDNTQTISVTTAGDATVSDLQTDTTTGTITWYASEADAQAGTNPLAGDTVLIQGATYYATQTVGACTSTDIFAVTVDIVLGRDNFDSKAFSYHPNPVKDILNLSYSSEITSVTVFNLLGQRVITQQLNATDVKIDMSSLADGAYVVNVTSGNTVKTIKVIKKQ